MSEGRELPTPLWDPATNRRIHDALPDTFVDVLSLVTHLGDGPVLVAVVMLFYWFGGVTDWRKRGKLLAIAVAVLALSAGLKGLLEVARPLYVADPPLAFAPDSYPGLSTPSAHAMGAAAIYGGLAIVMDVGKRWQRSVVAGVLVFLVALSRVTEGVHYVGDVVLGVALGLGLVVLGIHVVDESPRSVLPMFFVALVLAVLSYPAGAEEYVTVSVGAAAGGLVTWWLIHDTDPEPLGASELSLGVVVLPAFLVVALVERTVAVEVSVLVAGREVPVVAGFEVLGYAILFGVALALPLLAERLDENRYVQRLQHAIPFRGRVFDAGAAQGRYEEASD